jgi:hypothetical protein
VQPRPIGIAEYPALTDADTRFVRLKVVALKKADFVGRNKRHTLSTGKLHSAFQIRDLARPAQPL